MYKVIESLRNDKDYQYFSLEDVDEEGQETHIFINKEVAVCIDLCLDTGSVSMETIEPVKRKRELDADTRLLEEELKHLGMIKETRPKSRWYHLVKKYDLLFDTYTDYPNINALVEYLINP
jgi:hypothetical protein